MSSIHDTRIFGNAYDDEDVEEEVNMNNVVSSYTVPDAPFTKFLKDQVIGSLKTPVQTRHVTKINDEHGLISSVHKLSRTNHKDFQNFYQMDVKSAFLYGKIEEEMYVYQPPGFEDPAFQIKSTRTFFLFGKSDGIFLSQNKYVVEILKKFDFATVKTASTLVEPNKALIKDEEAKDVDVHLNRSMIGSLMYLTAYRPDITFVVCACARLDRKSTIGGCQFLGKRLISWQCKKQTIVANSTTKVEYIAATNCYGQVLWIQNQMLDYGFNFMNTKIYINNESTICIVKNPMFHSKTQHIEIRHHFIRDSYEKKLIQVIKIHTDQNVVDLLTKAFDVSRFNFWNASIGMLNL
ncbi:putative reverse transcriptase, RNA-dependent DNA polymerase [Tanacetum coccineum]